MSGAGGSAVEQLRWRYNNRHAAALDAHRAGKAVVGVTSNTVPVELIAAAGMFPLLLSPEEGSVLRLSGAPPHDIFMEDVFDARSRAMFDLLVSGQGGFLKSVIIPRTSEREHKLFLYLKEVQRQQKSDHLPDIYLYNMLHSRSEEALAYSMDRTVELKRHLEGLTGREIGEPSLGAEIAMGNAARASARRLVGLREEANPRLTGSQALALLGARYFMGASDYARLASAAANEIEQLKPLSGPHILIKGYPLDHPSLHREIEAHGAIVIAEDDPWGSRSATRDISTQGDPLEALVDHYHLHTTSARVFPLDVADRWFRNEARQADGVVFYLPPDDDVIGWDYPRHCAWLDGLGVPHLLVRIDARAWSTETSKREPAAHEASGRIADFVAHLGPKREG